MDRVRSLLTSRAILLLVLGLGFVFFACNAHLQLAEDDVGWLHGEAPTVFDQYRMIPRLFFVSLHGLFGLSPVAALAMIFGCHVVNTLLLHRLAGRLLGSRTPADVAAWVFMINPLTLATLTWISCFSYVLGTTFALMALTCFAESRTSGAPWIPWIGALACYGAGLLCSHELFFLPVLFLALGRLGDAAWLKRAALMSVAAMSLGLAVYVSFYGFARYGVEAARLFSAGFAAAFVSSVVSLGVGLWLAYPWSFLTHPTALLQVAFAEPVRWVVTLGTLASWAWLYTPGRDWRVRSALGLSFAALAAPYIIRLYLMPPGVHYDLSYVLTGRVFYLPFVILALVWGAFVSDVLGALRTPWKRSLALLPAGAYCYAVGVLYQPHDFMGLAVRRAGSQAPPPPPPWNPFTGSDPRWLASLALVAVLAGVRLARRGPRRQAPPNG